MNDDLILVRIIQFAGGLPWLLVMLLGGLTCLRRLSDEPRKSWLVGSAIALMLLARHGVPNAFNFFMQFFPGVINGSAAGMRYLPMVLFGLPGSIFQAVAWGLILYAVFGPQSDRRSRYLVEENDGEEKRE